VKPLRTLSLIRPNMGDWRSSDAFTPLALAILAARTPADVQVCLFDERLETIPADDCPDLVAITVETFTARRAYAIAKLYARQRYGAGSPQLLALLRRRVAAFRPK
jgi:hypothetical protein